jgi:hypothetical protein
MNVPGTGPVRLGLRENLARFALLVLVNTFVGAMVGLDRSSLPAGLDAGSRPQLRRRDNAGRGATGLGATSMEARGTRHAFTADGRRPRQ